MKVGIDKAVLENAAHWLVVDSIVHMFVLGRHQWAGNPDVIVASAWYRSSGRKRMVDDLLREMEPWKPNKPRSEGPHKRQVMVVADPPEDQPRTHTAIVVSDAVAALGGTFVLLEDATNDGGFLWWAVRHSNRKHLGEDFEAALRDDITRRRAAGKIVRVANGGGSNTGRELTRLHPERAPIFVLLDSDRDGPGRPCGSTVDSVRKKHQELGSPLDVHIQVLERREAENYMPASFLDDFARRHNKTLVYNALRDAVVGAHARFYDMEKGLEPMYAQPPKQPAADPMGLRALPPCIVERLRPGFGGSIKSAVADLASCDHPPDPEARDELSQIAQSLFDML